MMSVFDAFVLKYSRLPTEYDPDYLEMLAMSKYRILAVPDVSPGKCANCGSSKNDGRGYIDFGLHIDWYGGVFFCGECLKDIAVNFGLFTDINQKLLDSVVKEETISRLQENGEQLYTKVLTLFKEFEEHYASLSTIRDSGSSNTTTDVGSSETAIEPKPDETKSGVTKSTTGSRSKNVRSLTDLIGDTS
jgi:hypothetical protein